MLLGLVFLPILGGLIAWFSHVYLYRLLSPKAINQVWYHLPFIIVLMTLFISLGLAISLCFDATSTIRRGQEWMLEVNKPWMPLLGINFHLILNGLSLVMIMTTLFIVLLTILYSRKENNNKTGLFYLCILFMTSAVMLLFVTSDLFLLFFLWEAVAIPLYFLISLWGRRDSSAQLRFNGASKFLIYTQISSLILLISIVSLALINWNLTNQWTFDSQILIKTPISSQVELMLMFGFLIAFMVRTPLVPFHNWFIKAHSESSITGSLMLSGVLLNTTTYGLLKFVIPLFPNATSILMPYIASFSLLTVIYAALLAFKQTDIKKLIAYVHISLAGFISIMVYSNSVLAYQGVVIQMIAISLAIVGMFIISGILVECYRTRNINQFTDLKDQINYLSTFTLFFMLAVLGIPGSANFIGNYMMLLASYHTYSFYTILLVIGLLLLSISLIIRMQPIFYGAPTEPKMIKKSLAKIDFILLVSLLSVLFFIGLYPKVVLDMSYTTVNQIEQHTKAEKVGDQ